MKFVIIVETRAPATHFFLTAGARYWGFVLCACARKAARLATLLDTLGSNVRQARTRALLTIKQMVGITHRTCARNATQKRNHVACVRSKLSLKQYQVWSFTSINSFCLISKG